MKFNNIGITGHTSGIGKGLYDHFLTSSEHVQGFSLTNGFDINNSADLERIIELTKECDLFLNNAYSKLQQSEIAKLWQDAHWNKNHFIINTSSIAADPLANIQQSFPWLTQYAEEKHALNEASWKINHSGSVCKSIVIMPGAVNTNFHNPYASKINNGEAFHAHVLATNSVITVADIVTSVDLILQSINGRNFIASISLLNDF